MGRGCVRKVINEKSAPPGTWRPRLWHIPVYMYPSIIPLGKKGSTINKCCIVLHVGRRAVVMMHNTDVLLLGQPFFKHHSVSFLMLLGCRFDHGKVVLALIVPMPCLPTFCYEPKFDRI